MSLVSGRESAAQTVAQAMRRERILDATVALAKEGGYDAV